MSIIHNKGKGSTFPLVNLLAHAHVNYTDSIVGNTYTIRLTNSGMRILSCIFKALHPGIHLDKRQPMPLPKEEDKRWTYSIPSKER